jgi:predicted nucleic acid-binding protein
VLHGGVFRRVCDHGLGAGRGRQLAGARPNRALFCELYQDLAKERRVTIVPAAQDLFEQGIELFAKRPDKEWSLTDCISFIVMQEYELTDAVTADHHFEQAGFRILLEDEKNG